MSSDFSFLSLKFRGKKKKFHTTSFTEKQIQVPLDQMILFHLVAILYAVTSNRFGKREFLYGFEGFQFPEHIVLHHKNTILNDHRKLTFWRWDTQEGLKKHIKRGNAEVCRKILKTLLFMVIS